MRSTELLVGCTALAVALTGVLTASAAPEPRLVVERPAAAVSTPTTRPTPPVPVVVQKPVVNKKRPTRPGPLAAAPPLTGCPVRRQTPGGPGRPLGAPAVAEAALPAPLPVARKAANLEAVRGKGLWVTPFGATPVDVDGLIATARRTHVRSLWIRTGGTRQGYYGNRFLSALVTKAHAHGLAVVAWDFPFLSDPVVDARRAHAALAAGVDAFSPDLETAAEGTHVSARRIAFYLSMVRAYAGERPVVATVPRPSDLRLSYPYKAFVPYADVFAPMVYWSCNEPGALVQQSLQRLRRYLPVAPVGQGYDMGPEGGRRGTPSRAETLRFLDAARRGGSVGASLWTVEEAGPAQLRALADYAWPS
ncbi:MAG: Peptidoglycan-binding domain 1 protein [Frankiales bacterium]|nr:Peptidoglycan-binding domain 1 protein [Frankiales bacterium]